MRGTGPACRRALQRAIGGLDQYEGAMVANAEGVVTCASGPMPQVVKVDDRVWFRDIMAGDGFVVSDLIVSRWLGSWGIVTAVPLVDEQGLIQGSVALFIGLDWLAQRYQRGARSEDGAAFALLDSRGEIITRDASRSPAKSPLPRNSLIHEQLREQLPAGQTRTFRARGHDGIWRLYAVSPLLGGRIFVIRGTPVLTAIGPLALQVAWGVLTPLLMWALAIAVVWFGIENLVVRWITYLERITSAYAAGRHNVRPERVSAAPAEIRSLGETFSRMADLISARESELRESLAQKEVLVREIHHRVKNNLQLVMSLLNLHARRIRDPRAELAFAEARSRINALATLHRRLYESESLQEIDLQVVPRGSVRRAASRRAVARPLRRADRQLAERSDRARDRGAARAAGDGSDHQRVQARVQRAQRRTHICGRAAPFARDAGAGRARRRLGVRPGGGRGQHAGSAAR